MRAGHAAAVARDARQLLARIEPVADADGRLWWPLRDVCDALHVPDQAAARRLVPAEHRRTTVERLTLWTKTRRSLIDAEGVRLVAIRYSGGVPVSELTAALKPPAEV